MNYIEDMFGLSGKTVLITGGGGVIAASVTEAFLLAGARVCLWDLHPVDLRPVRERLRSFGIADPKVEECVVNVTNEDEVEECIGSIIRAHGKIDVLVNAVGGNKGKSPFVDVDIAVFEEVLKLNLIAGLVVTTKHVARHWIEEKHAGAVINFASMSSFVPLSGVWAYNAAKAAVVNLTMATAKELAPHGIRVNAVAPGFFLGKQNRDLLVDEKTGELTERGSAVIAHTPFGRFGEPDELHGAILFLASGKAAGFITGVTLPIDGGYLVHNI